MTYKAMNGPQWRQGMRDALVGLELDSEEAVVDLAGSMSKLMREGAPEMDADERRRRQATEGTRLTTRKRPGRSTIRFRRGRDRTGFYVDVGAGRGAFHLAFYEYGTRRQPARPFLRPAIERAIAGWNR